MISPLVEPRGIPCNPAACRHLADGSGLMVDFLTGSRHYSRRAHRRVWVHYLGLQLPVGSVALLPVELVACRVDCHKQTWTESVAINKR